MAAFSELSSGALQNFSGCVAMLVIAIIFIALRFYVRSTLRQPPYLTDWLCLVSYLVFVAYAAVIFNHIFNVSKTGAFEGSGVIAGSSDIGGSEAKAFMKASLDYALMGLTIELIFTLDITVVKLSILAFYWTLFGVEKIQKQIIWMSTAICLVWWIVFTFLIIFQCRPINYLWDTFGQADTCISTPKLLLAVELTNLFIDIGILLIPVYAVRHLRLDRNRKFSLLGIFLLGAAVCVTSIVRVTAIWNPPNVMANFQFAKTVLCSTLQLGMAIICGCVPTLGPLFTSAGTRARSWYDSAITRHAATSSSYKMTDGPTGLDRPWANVGGSQYRNTTRSWAGREDESSNSMHHLDPLPPSKIRVQRSIEISK
ncbi:unnamed protein product [Clonostachys rosea f. rosea IK726]|uniref:Rhodopsin domain-containing protein n=2 Tax=Bionectria ochroleuca TaxID=29856 RepID=A0A0B7KG30_BIOOC|nr:unnamed protein product [Clonostachys rosea f. rosea IK726]